MPCAAGPKLCHLMPFPFFFSQLHLARQWLNSTLTLPSDYSFAQPNMLASNAPGMFSFCQTGPADLAGSSWDTTVEGSQNFPELADAADYYTGEAEDFVLPFGQNTPKPDHLEAVDDFHARWNPAVAVESKALKAEP